MSKKSNIEDKSTSKESNGDKLAEYLESKSAPKKVDEKLLPKEDSKEKNKKDKTDIVEEIVSRWEFDNKEDITSTIKERTIKYRDVILEGMLDEIALTGAKVDVEDGIRDYLGDPQAKVDVSMETKILRDLATLRKIDKMSKVVLGDDKLHERSGYANILKDRYFKVVKDV